MCQFDREYKVVWIATKPLNLPFIYDQTDRLYYIRAAQDTS